MRYTLLWETPRRPYLDTVRVVLGAGATGAVSPTLAVFDNVTDCTP